MNIDFNSPEYKKSRKAYVTQCTLEHLVTILIMDAFLAKLLSHLGLSDALVGIVSSFTSISFVFQLLSVFIVQSKISTKKIVIFADVLSQMFFMLIYFVPFTPIPETARKLLVAFSIMVAYAGRSIISFLYFKWANTYVPSDTRATFSAKKECISLIVGIVFSSIMGFIIDKYESIGDIEGGFLFIAVTLLIINIANFISLLMIKDESLSARESMRVPAKEILHHIFVSNKIFRNYTLIGFLGSFSGGLIGSFLGIYKTKDLAFGILTIQIINIIADFIRMGVSLPIAKFSNKYGFAKGIQLSSIMNTIGYFAVVFTTPATRWLIALQTCLNTASMAASYQNSFNIGYTLLPQKYMAQAMSVRSTMGGIITFATAIFAGKILNTIQANGNMIFGIHLYAQQFLAFCSVIGSTTAMILRNKFVLKPIEKMKQK